ncbi:MAG: flagellar motor switch phosphatase FliY [Lachnospiraceae bacterium]|nr:flagellar motor switch phosphatase FliY [Lachnospiraceae bacterium]
MDGMLSQEEINALLNGMDLSAEGSTDMPEMPDIPDMDLNNLEIFQGDYLSGTEATSGGAELLSDVEKDAIGEVANISMGSSATTLYSLVNRKVNITTPVVTLATWDSLLEEYEKPCVFIQIRYTKGLDGSNILVLKEQDVKIITDLMMGGDGSDINVDLGEMHLSAISEAMNQMMGAAATSLSTMLKTVIDISPPDSSLLDLSQFQSGAEVAPFLGGTFVKIAFRMQIDELVDSTIMQLYPIEFAKKLVETFISNQLGMATEEPVKEIKQPTPAPEIQQQPVDMTQGMNMNGGMNPMGMMPGFGMGMNPMQNFGMPPMQNFGMAQQPQQNVNVQQAMFQNFAADLSALTGQENINLIMDVPLEVTVELGRTAKSISEILNFAPGTIIELDRIAGEPIDVLVNGKFVAKGEVVVIEENYGIRVTEILK